MPKSPAETQQKKQEIIEAVATHLLHVGFRDSGVRALAKSIGMSDRMVMYYFKKKEDLIEAALLLLAEHLSAGLDEALPSRTASATAIVDAMVASATAEQSRPLLKLWFEIVGLAVRGDEPYQSVARLFLKQWIIWIENKLPKQQRHRAGELLARIEGEVMLKLLNG